MPALRKPHRVAFLVPELVVEGGDAPNAAEAGLLLWVACIEVCQRHPGLAVFDAESTPLVSQDGHFTPHHARPGATPGDSFYGPTRRDELVWLELALPRPGAVRLHALARDGMHDTFEAAGRNTGDQIHQAIERWLAARKLGALSRKFEAVETGDLLAAVRVFAAVLGEQARAQFQIESLGGAQSAEAAAADRTELGGESGPGPAELSGVTSAARATLPGRRIARALAGRLTATLKAPALRLIALALREDLSELILAADPEQPQALFARFRAELPRRRDDALLRRIIASAPCWALPYRELIDDGSADPAGADAGADGAADGAGDPAPPTWLETSAGAGIAALCQPGQLDVIQAAAARLAEDGRIDDGLRVLERAVALYPDAADAHVALLRLHRRAGRLGAWLAQVQASAALHGCPLDPGLPWYGDQIQIDLLVADALLHAGRIDEAIALRASRLEGRDASWPRHTRILASWRKDARLLARSYAREGWLRGDPGRAIEGYGRTQPDEPIDVAFLLDALVAVGREDEVAFAWSQFGLGHEITEPVARLAAARCLLAAGDWRRGVEELWRVALTEPGRDIQAQVARAGLLLSCAPLDVLEAALGERVAIGAMTLARRMARDAADFVPGAARSSIVLRALGKPATLEFDPAWLAGFPADTRSRRAIDALFAEPAPPRGSSPAIASPPAGDPADLLARSGRLVNHWLPVVFTEVAEDDAAGLAQAAAYVAGCALGRYLAATTAAPSPLAGGYRVVAAEALALVWRHRRALADRDARALLGVLDPLLRRIDRWLGSLWLGVVERSCAIDERADGDVAGFAREHAMVASRILGPEETAVLGTSVARLYRERPEGWASAVAAQAGRLALHTGHAGTDEWADAVACQLAGREIETEDAIDVLHTACYLAEGVTAVPCAHAARVLLAAGRAPAALSVLCAGLGASDAEWRAAQVAALAEPWAAHLDLPLDRERAVAQLFEALEAGEPVRAEKLGRLAVALDPDSAEAQRNLGLALAQQGKLPEALHHLTLGTSDQATEILGGVLHQGGRLAEANALRAYARRWLDRAPSAGAVGDAAPPRAPRAPVFDLLEAGDFSAAAAQLGDPSWRVRRAALAATRMRSAADHDVAVPLRARAAAEAVLAETIGVTDREAVLARDLALAIREQAYFARDPLPQLGDRMTRDAFHRELATRGGSPLAELSGPAPPAARLADRNAVPDGRLSQVSDYVALIRDLAVLTPREALAEFDLDDAGYLEVATAWARAIAADPTLAAAIAAGLAKR